MATARNIESNYQQQHETLKHLDQITTDLPWNYKDKQKSTKNIEAMEVEENLSQKMNQLSTQTKTENQNASSLKDIQIDLETIPDYLTKQNQSLQQMIGQVAAIIKSNDKEKMKDLRKITILIYRIKSIQLYQHLWTSYLKAGTSQLNIQSSKQTLNYPTNIPVWPKEIQTMVQATMKIDKEKKSECCSNFVQRYLQVLADELNKYEAELKIKMNQFPSYLSRIQQQIETYIEQNLQSLRKEIEHKTELIHYDYQIRVLKLEYLRHQPNEYQKQLMKKLCQEKHEQETTEQEYNLVQKQIAHYNLPNQSFESSPLAHSLLIDSVADPTLRQQLFKQYREVAEQSRAKIFHLYLTTAQDERVQCKNTYDTSMKKMWSDRQVSLVNEQIPFNMIDLINERGKKISERIQCIYKFKTQSIGSNSKL